jgi:hypothetical protein
MAQIAGTNVIAPVVPGDTADVFPSHLSEYGKGGYRTVGTIAARDAIPEERREELMLVAVVETGKVYQLVGGITNGDWVETSLSTSPAGYASYVAAHNLSGHKIVATNEFGLIYYADNTDMTCANSVVGMTSGAIMEGETGPVRTHGSLDHEGWSWIPQMPIFVVGEGGISQIPPIEGFSLCVGFAMSETRVFINISLPIILGG